MTVSIAIWSVFSLIEALSALGRDEDAVKPIAMTLAVWIVSALLLMNDYASLFFAINIIPSLLLFTLGGFDLLVSPPGSDTNRPQMYIASGIIRTAFIIACCYAN